MAVAGAVGLGGMGNAAAQNLNAGFVLDEMTPGQRISYIQGVMDGLAYSRFLQDRPDTTVYDCIVNWYQTEHESKHRFVMRWLAKHPEKPANVLLYTIVKKECGA
ncbi:MAG: hypothetical protein KDJ29_13915 [Hyphomicrobiales bacterium]|nr:hypothetical protein [Nitratireductor sp.]MCC2097989.1 hypothetical protein [Hyphomicrobiales bacterium]